ncbi:SpoU rRNA methylase family protein [Anseongella ginsenosidimutans]|uniref:SpoU rRNA methylase family protein n=1 Tax=Anseongella ginsenosidimutans TaxID=496056 RepID=A0A4R3KSG4_9SPHI|nr:RNA methyltransferase [Anseongella ginsenosidimutans]QEC52975.1 RNA methyltransferase [Anseongella ginsenosidimutans]TCS87379.1 SpoU rRNA methylase family protein [Anseongella ginsenosidimutans]
MRKLKNEELGRPGLEEFRKQPKLPLAIVLDNVRSMNNVGSVFRTADAFSVEEIWLCGITGQPPHREIEKTALGATRSVRWQYARDIHEALNALQEENYLLIAIEQAEQSLPLNEFRPLATEKYAFIFGNEVNGVSDEAMARAGDCIEIPQFGTKHSLNIAVSAGILVWDYYLKRFYS